MKIFLFAFLILTGGSVAAAEMSTPVPPDSLQCDTLWLKSGKIMLVTIISNSGSEIKFTACPPNDIISTIPKSSTKLSPRDSLLAAQRASLCDTIFLKSGEVEMGHMKYYNSRKVVYTGCCSECTSEKMLKRSDVDSIIYADGRKLGTKLSGTNAVNNTNTDPKIEKPVTPEKVYTPEEIETATKRSKIFGIIGLCGIPVALTGFALMVFVTSVSNPVGFGLIFFAGVILGLVMAMLYVRNRKKAGLTKDKKRNKK